MMKASKVIFILIHLLLISSSAFADLTVIANAALKDEGLTEEKIRNFFTGKAKADSLTLSAQPESSKTGKEFISKFLNMTPAELKIQWSILVFSGHRTPIIQDNDQSVIDYVGSHTNAVGYVETRSLSKQESEKKEQIIELFKVR